MKRMRFVSLFLAALLALTPLSASAEDGADDRRVTDPYCPPGLPRTAQAATATDLPARDCWPYSAVACLEVEMACGCIYYGGTGFLVEDDCLMTAGHMLVCLSHGKPVTRLRASFGYVEQDGQPDSCLYQYETTAPMYWYNSLVLTASGREGWDYGFVRMPEQAGQTVGHFGLSVRSDDELTDLPVEVVGYPGGAFIPLTGQTLLVSENTLRHSAPASPGHSGSPVFDASGCVIAVHNSHTVNGSGTSLWSAGARVTQRMIDEMCRRGFIKRQEDRP